MRLRIDARGGARPLALLAENGDRFLTADLGYAGGLREPHLARTPSVPDRLGASIAPRTRRPGKPGKP